MEDPKVMCYFVYEQLYETKLTVHSSEPTSLVSPIFQRYSLYPYPTVGHYCRHTELQYQNRFRRRAHHEPALIWTMLVICGHEHFPGSHYAQTQLEGVRAEPGLPFLLG